MKTKSKFLAYLTFLAFLTLFVISPSYAAQMEDYCLIPPYVMRGGVPPNIMIVYEKGDAIANRAYSTTYGPISYYGFFDSGATYAYCNPTTGASPCATTGNYFQKLTCTPSAAAATNCFSGNLLNWALMSSLDISRKVLIGFGEPATGTSDSAGAVFTYTGTLTSKGQANGATVSGGGYTFCLDGAVSNPTGLKIRFGEGHADCSLPLVIGDVGVGGFRDVAMRFTDEDRIGLIQKLGDKDRDMRFDNDVPRFGIRRWHSGNDKQRDIIRDVPALTLSERESYLRDLLTSTSKAPPSDTQPTSLADMMTEIVKYFRGLSSAYTDGSGGSDALTQSPYSWANDPLKACRKTFALYMTTGSNLTGTAISPLPSACSSLVYPNEAPYTTTGLAGTTVTDPFSKNTCAAFNTDLYTADGTPPRQNISTFVVHTTFYGGSTSTTEAKLQYAANISDGQYYKADKPEELMAALERAILEMLRRASSGTAASVLASGEGSGANLVQVVFYPETPRIPIGIFDRRVSWLGRLVNYWYFVDPLFTSSTILDDDSGGTPDKILNLSNDKKVTFRFAHADDATVADRYNFGSTTLIDTIRFERTINLWDAGVELWKRDISVAANKRKIYTTINGTSFLAGNFSQDTNNGDSDNAAALWPYLNLTTVPTDDLNSSGSVTVDDARVLIRYIHGEDFHLPPSNYSLRQRTVAVDLNGDGDTADAGEGAKVWKLSDVLNSTPRISSWIPLNTYDQVYSDPTYKSYIDSVGYKNRGMVFAGGNDGMLHAFKLGTLEIVNDPATPPIKARLNGSDLGKEMWAFIPKNALPYLKYLTEIEYCHVYTVDLTPYIFDASINGNPDADKTVSSWRTILIGGMRYGGACKPKNVNCSTATPDSVCAPAEVGGASVGYSSYFALDVTDQNNPALLWEFSDPQLGFTTTGPAVVRISARNDDGTPNKEKNGHWFVVFGSGPTGPTTRSPEYQFLGRSDQPLRLFVIPLRVTPGLPTVTTIDTAISNAFAGSMLNTTLDSDLNYQDDVVYIPYVKRGDVIWNQGGVLRLLTKENPNPSNWVWSRVVDDVGPVTSSVTKLLNKNKGILWLYFGTGRYYFEMGANTDDPTAQRQLFGVKEPCFSSSGFDLNCTTSVSGLTNVTDIGNVPSESTANSASFKGWYIDLDAPSTYTYLEGGFSVTRDYRAERVITDPLATTTGLVFFTTYKPYNDICAYGGKSFIWAVKYSTGGAPGALLKGVALLQVSTGAIEQINLSEAFTEAGDRKTSALEGVPPTAQGLSIMSQPPPVKRVIHMRER